MNTLQEFSWDGRCRQLLSIQIIMKIVPYFSSLMQKPTLISILSFQQYCTLHVFQCPAGVHTVMLKYELQKSLHHLFQIYVACLSLPLCVLTLLHHSFHPNLALHRSGKNIRFYFRILLCWETKITFYGIVYGRDVEEHMKMSFY